MKQKAIPYHQWPAKDQSAWSNAIAKGDWFEEQGLAANWTIASQNSIRSHYGRWLGFIHDYFPTYNALSVAERVTPQTIEHYTNVSSKTVSCNTVSIYIDHLHCALRVMATDHDWSWLKQIKRHLKRDVTPKQKRHRMVDSQRLYALGIALMDNAEKTPANKKLTDAILYRDGLLIALLAARPLRRRSLALLQIGKHLVKNGTHYLLSLAACDTKNKHAIDYDLPTALTPYLDCYLNVYRKRFPNAGNHNSLWASAKGGPLSGSELYRRIIARTRTAFGFAINPHLFRDCAATTLAIYKPDQVLTGAGLLGHASLNTLHDHYIHAQTIKAGLAHQTNLKHLRHRLDGKETTRDEKTS